MKLAWLAISMTAFVVACTPVKRIEGLESDLRIELNREIVATNARVELMILGGEYPFQIEVEGEGLLIEREGEDSSDDAEGFLFIFETPAEEGESIVRVSDAASRRTEIEVTYRHSGVILATSVSTPTLNDTNIYDAIETAAGEFVALTSRNPNASDIELVRFSSNGVFDESFGVSGVAVVPGRFRPGCLMEAADGGFLLVGNTEDIATQLSVHKLNPNGLPDLNYGFNGVQEIVLPAVAGNTVRGCRMNANGEIIVAMQSRGVLLFDYYLTRLFPNGIVDPNFGNAGIATISLPAAQVFAGVTIGPEGRILVGGTGVNASNMTRTPSVVRFTADGQVDTEFGEDGVVTPFTGGIGGDVDDILVTSAGNIYVAVTEYLTNSPVDGSVTIFAYDTNGMSLYSLDGSADFRLGRGPSESFGNMVETTDERILFSYAVDGATYVSAIDRYGQMDLSLGNVGILDLGGLSTGLLAGPRVFLNQEGFLVGLTGTTDVSGIRSIYATYY